MSTNSVMMLCFLIFCYIGNIIGAFYVNYPQKLILGVIRKGIFILSVWFSVLILMYEISIPDWFIYACLIYLALSFVTTKIINRIVYKKNIKNATIIAIAELKDSYDTLNKALFMFDSGITSNEFYLHNFLKNSQLYKDYTVLCSEVRRSIKSYINVCDKFPPEAIIYSVELIVSLITGINNIASKFVSLDDLSKADKLFYDINKSISVTIQCFDEIVEEV